MEERTYCVYIVASKKYGTLYIGVTSDLVTRMNQHRSGEISGFTQKHGVKTLVWYEQFVDISLAIAREKALKFWKRDWKVRLIEDANPDWHDLAIAWGFEPV